MRQDLWTKAAPTVAAVVLVSSCNVLQPTKKEGQKAEENNNALTGKWAGSCASADWLSLGHQKQSFTFGALGDFDSTTTLFSDDGCTQPAADLTEHGTYASLGGSPDVENATDINFTATDYTVTPRSDAAVKLMNEGKYCGLTNWAKDQGQSVVDKTCLGHKYAKGDVTFDIYNVSDNDLTFGKSSLFLTKSDASNRPTELDEANVYTKQ